jgi:hypothetical protein
VNLKNKPIPPKPTKTVGIKAKHGRGYDDIAETLAAAAQRLGCTMSDLRRARDAGCPGFAHGRVKIPVVKKWLEANPPAEDDMDEEALKKRKLLAQCRKLELDEAILRGEFTGNAEIIRSLTALGSEVRSEWLLLVSEAPLWAGLSAAEIRDKSSAFVTTALSRMSHATASIQKQCESQKKHHENL